MIPAAQLTTAVYTPVHRVWFGGWVGGCSRGWTYAFSADMRDGWDECMCVGWLAHGIYLLLYYCSS